MTPKTKFDVRHCAEVAQSCLAFNLRRADRAVMQLYDEALKPAGIRATQHSLLMGLRAMEPATISDLAQQLGLDRTTLTRNLKVLEAEGFASSDSGEDLRERHICLTPKGHRVLHAALPLWRSAQAQIEERLGGPEVSALVKRLAKIPESKPAPADSE